jgi:hypothetical protein
MGYAVILIALVLFFSAMTLHVVVWRVFRLRRFLQALIIVLMVIPVIAVFIIHYAISPEAGSFSISDWLGVLLMHLSLTSAYILSYPAIQAKCPSLTMLLLIENSDEKGTTMEELSDAFSDESIRDSRLDDLVNDSMVVCKDGDYYMTSKGGLILKPLIVLRRLLGLPTGEG